MARRFDEEWQEVRSRRSRRHERRFNYPDIATQKDRGWDRSAPQTTYYFSEFPDHFGAWEMLKVFQHYGDIQEVVIPAKRNKLGRRFGFARFCYVHDEERFGVELDNIIIGRDKIFVNTPRFQRERRGHITSEEDRRRDHVEEKGKQANTNNI
ncbi:RNA-binding protein 25-like [Trifolium medium]|uniref:RNA-binding protein 25-like n=1 Tax=Trifolium medium TaxID=97028 RepID=A0A392Q8M6_9FABA|nr:RNA-binding protein 25-like [Trifolium medium]